MNSVVGGGQYGVTSMLAKPVYQPAAHPIARIHLFGPMRAVSYLGDDILPRGKKSRALLACLCLNFGARVPRARLRQLLWDKVADAQARQSLGASLHEITSAMGSLAKEIIVVGRTTVRLNANACWIDALVLLNPSSPDEVRSDLARLCDGELLEGLNGVTDPFDRWLDQLRTRVAETMRLPAATGPARARPADISSSPPAVPGDTRHHPLPGRNRLRVTVLPFEGKGGNREDALAFSLSHQIAAALARFRWFDVISPVYAVARPLLNSATLLGRQLDYAIDGAVSRHGRALEINVRLLDLARASQVWSERFELASDALHQLNDLVTPRVVASIDPAILFIEGQPKRRSHYGATGLLFLAIPLFYSMDRAKFDRAGQLIKRALAIGPENTMALAWSAFWHITRYAHGWTSFEISMTESAADASRAIDLDPENAEALAIYAHTCAWKKELDLAIDFFARSLRLNPNLVLAWWLSAATYCYIGDPNEALRRLMRCRELAPLDPHSHIYENVYSIAYTLKGDHEQAVLIGRSAVKSNPNYPAAYKPLITALGHLGRADEAKPYIDKLLSLEPNFSVERFGRVYPLRNASDRASYMKGLRLAGVPEK
ncbi:MAG: hypothetical protein JO328_10810 [Hyphomicrobiales bacterium]|nr:hypothetical protein [Hyphomicrobiales bacterium]MBV9427963.1 hypothetical protein [Bradyrhizobiaceae bacterium]